MNPANSNLTVSAKEEVALVSATPCRPATSLLVLTSVRQLLVSIEVEKMDSAARSAYIHQYMLFLFKIITSVDEQMRE